MKLEEIKFGTVTILVNVGGTAPLVITGTVLAELPRHHDDPPTCFPKKIEIDGEVTAEEEFLIVRVTSAVLPADFPLTIAELTTDLAINVSSIILVLPVTVV
ncbi:MAG: hypothetical protein E6713_00695 [Sporomusaceae bacterium]|nr:hypothetical protein [Sporomusaceae bacterium]